MPKTICKICDNDEFENVNGRYYCTVCNSQHHGVFDMEFSDEETDHKGTHELSKAVVGPKNTAKVEQEEHERNVDMNYSTFHVFNHLLKAQADDLIKLGVNPIVKKVILEIWSKYLSKLKVAFCDDLEARKTGSNVKWLRDKRYFEIYELKLEHETEQVQKMDTGDYLDDSSFNNEPFSGVDPSPQKIEPNDPNLNDKSEDAGNSVAAESTESSHESVAEEYDETEIEENTLVQDKRKRANLLLTKFEWIRMPHTVAILNLALLILKSPILVTDLVRLIYDGKISYFNIEKVLPEGMQFIYDRDSLMFNVYSLPKCEYLRYLTAKLGQYLGLGSIQIIELNIVTARYVLDLNLPRDLNALIGMLLRKIEPVSRLNFKKAENINIEEMALSYLYICLVILFEYDASNQQTLVDADNLFQFEEWIKEMQNTIFNAEKRIIGCNIDEVRNMKDLNALKISSFHHRHKLNTKPYISKFRRTLIQKALKTPLDVYGFDETLTKDESSDVKKDELDSGKENQSLSSSLFYLYERDRLKNPALKSFAFQKIDAYFTEEKHRLLKMKQQIKSKKYMDFLDEYFRTDNNEGIGRYSIGLDSNNCYWLIDIFQEISQSRSLFKIYKRVSKMLNRL